MAISCKKTSSKSSEGCPESAYIEIQYVCIGKPAELDSVFPVPPGPASPFRHPVFRPAPGELGLHGQYALGVLGITRPTPPSCAKPCRNGSTVLRVHATRGNPLKVRVRSSRRCLKKYKSTKAKTSWTVESEIITKPKTCPKKGKHRRASGHCHDCRRRCESVWGDRNRNGN